MYVHVTDNVSTCTSRPTSLQGQQRKPLKQKTEYKNMNRITTDPYTGGCSVFW